MYYDILEGYVDALRFKVRYKYKDRRPDLPEYADDPDESAEYERVEVYMNNKNKKMICALDVVKPSNILEISSIKCTYDFFYNCRILKLP